MGVCPSWGSMIEVYEALVKWLHRENWSTRRKTCTCHVSHRKSQLELSSDWTSASVVRSRHLTAWVMSKIHYILLSNGKYRDTSNFCLKRHSSALWKNKNDLKVTWLGLWVGLVLETWMFVCLDFSSFSCKGWGLVIGWSPNKTIICEKMIHCFINIRAKASRGPNTYKTEIIKKEDAIKFVLI